MNIKSILFVFLLIVAVGCKGGRSVDGKWTVSAPAEMPAGATMVAEFSGGSKLTIAMDMEQPMPDGSKAKIRADIVGTYTTSGETMSLKADDVKFSVTGLPDNLKSLVDGQLKVQNEQVKKQINEQQQQAKLTWVDDNSFTLTGKDGKPQTFTRAK